MGVSRSEGALGVPDTTQEAVSRWRNADNVELQPAVRVTQEHLLKAYSHTKRFVQKFVVLGYLHGCD